MSTNVESPVVHYICRVKKCGEIQMTPDAENFHLICDFCTRIFVELIEFIKHIQSEKCVKLSENLLEQQDIEIDTKGLTKVYKTQQPTDENDTFKQEPPLESADEQYEIESNSSGHEELAATAKSVEVETVVCAGERKRKVYTHTSMSSIDDDDPLANLQECDDNQTDNEKMDTYDWKVDSVIFSERLIDEVKKRACLYDISKKDYRNLKKKQKIWKEIGIRLQTRDHICRKRWKSLRDSYKRQIRNEKVMTTDSGTAKLPNKKWKFVERMSFLKKVRDRVPYNYSTNYIPPKKTVATKKQGSSDATKLEAPPCPPLLQLKPEMVSNSTLASEENVNLKISAVTTSSNPKHFETKPVNTCSEADVRAAFTAMMEKCCEKLGQIASAAPAELKTTTLRLFESLAYKITSSALSETDMDDIEKRVVTIVYEEILKCRQRKQKMLV